MYQRNLMKKQIESSGVRLGDSCNIHPVIGHKKAFTLSRHCIDLVSSKYRPDNLSMSYIELPKTDVNPFHYRLELDDTHNQGRFVLKTMKGNPFWLNGSAAKEAYVERMDRIYIDDNKVNFDPFDLGERVSRSFDHPLLLDQALVTSQLKILIQGETGTGKTYLASRIHEKSGRCGKFVAVNLSSFNPQIIESELFGHKKGSFTGAYVDRIGAFEEAENGTLFLDEIDSLPMELQTKLLTFLDSHSFRKVGEIKEIKIKARMIFASGRSLETLVQQGIFRRDFYYRLKSGHTTELSPLRNETEKIKSAMDYFSLKNNISFSKRLSDFYETLAWPGNLRQLFGHLEKKMVLSHSAKIDFDYLDEDLMLQSSDLLNLTEKKDILPMTDFRDEYIKKAVFMFDGNINLASRKLKVSPKTIKNVLAKTNSPECK
jgi:transcriptional regulator with GAF, ATPase, and Fis domain